MTSHLRHGLRYHCADRGCYLDQLPKWDDIAGCFAGNVAPTDIDGFVERHGRFLFLEHKGTGVPFDTGGQFRGLRRLSTLPGVTVQFHRPTPAGTSVDVLTLPTPGQIITMSRDAFLDELRLWDAGP